MNYLELVQRLWLESGASGTSPGPSAVASQTGENQRLVTWVNEAWKDIQTAHSDWGWMRASASFTTVASTATYTIGTGAGTVGVSTATFGEWERNTARAYLTSTGTDAEVFLDYIPYEAWRNRYQFGVARGVDIQPTEFSISPAKAICIPPALTGYTVTLDYFTAPLDMSADGDTPALPTQYHMAIVYKAMMMYGMYESAQEVFSRGELEFSKLMRRLDESRLPEVTFG